MNFGSKQMPGYFLLSFQANAIYLFILLLFTHNYKEINGVAMYFVWFTIFWVTKKSPGYDLVVNMSPMWSPAPVS